MLYVLVVKLGLSLQYYQVDTISFLLKMINYMLKYADDAVIVHFNNIYLY